MLQPPGYLYCDDLILLQARADLNGLEAADVRVECLLGREGPGESFEVLQRAELAASGRDGSDTLFGIELAPEIPGLQSYRVRIYPYNEALSHPFELGCMLWV
jgi:starch phosphorylase